MTHSTLAILLLAAMHAAAPAIASDDEVVARIDGDAITLEEVEEMVTAQLKQLEQQRRQLIENALTAVIEQRLLEKEAEKRGVVVDDLLANEVESKVTEPTAEEIDQWYNQNRSRIRASKEQVEPQIRKLLSQQKSQELRGELVAALRGEHEVDILYQPYRVDLSLEGATLKGPEEAPITIVEFSDFQCPACKSFNPTLSKIAEDYGKDVRVAFRQYPLRAIHPQAEKAAQASLCARDQGKFWELHDHMFANQKSLQVENLKSAAETLGLDAEAFASCLESGRYAEMVQADVDRGAAAGVSGTPSVYVNGRPVSSGKVPSYEILSSVIDDELARRKDSD